MPSVGVRRVICSPEPTDMTHRTIEIPLPSFAGEGAPQDIVAGVTLFIERLSNRLNTSLEDAAPGEEAVREMFADFITVAAMNRQQPWRLTDPNSTESEVLHIEDKIHQIVQEIEL